MEYAQWDAALETGNAVIDGQHRDIYRLVSELHDRLGSGLDDTVIEDALFRIMHYAGTHFACEEDLMRRVDFPDLERHRRLHAAFVSDAQILTEKFLARHDAVGISLTSWIRQWLTEHICAEDRRIVEHMKATPAGQDGV